MGILASLFRKPDQPVTDEEWREAYRWFERDPGTKTEPCSNRGAHPDHLWRYVWSPGMPPVDESMKKCPGIEAAR
jgi:hypothetical protein